MKAAKDTGSLAGDDWSRAALDLLAEQGIDGVRVEPLARRLAVTKGSFYWHFKDRDALHARMLSDWRRRTTLDLIERLDRGGATPRDRLRRLLRLPLAGDRSARAADVELAIRLWGRRDPRARAALEEVDELRLSYIARLLVACDVAKGEARPRAILAYSYLRVAATLLPREDADMLDRCETLLIGR